MTILTNDGSHLNVNLRETETGDPLIILLSIHKLSCEGQATGGQKYSVLSYETV